MNGRLWTDEEIQTLKAMIGWKATIEMMCEALSRSKDSIVAKATQLGLVAIQRQKSTGKNLIQVPFRNTQSCPSSDALAQICALISGEHCSSFG